MITSLLASYYNDGGEQKNRRQLDDDDFGVDVNQAVHNNLLCLPLTTVEPPP